MAKKQSTARRDETSGKDEEVDFEMALAEVERIVSELESGELGLTASLEQYEKGVRRLKNCHALLHSAERRVALLSGLDADGNPLTEPIPDVDIRTTDGDEGDQSALGGGSSTHSSVDDSPGLF